MRIVLTIFILIIFSAGCMDRGATPACSTGYQYEFVYPSGGGGYRGIDILLIVDNSSSAADEQALLAETIPTLVDALTVPSKDNAYRSVYDLRIAAVTSDMGLSWGGRPYEDGDGWPDDLSTVCTASGDDGEFQIYPSGTSITLDGEELECPDLNSWWAETCAASPNDDIGSQAACLAQVGTDGCGLEQPLRSGVAALHRPEQYGFIRDSALLAVIAVTDEDDCSIEDGPGFFATDDIRNLDGGPSRVPVACGNNQEFLYAVDDLRQSLQNVKGHNERFVFAAFGGVPMGEECEGRGSEIGGCLDHPAMRLTEYLSETVPGYPSFKFEPACRRPVSIDGKEGETALPARRMVELATAMGEAGYVVSVCDDDWRDDMNAVGNMALDHMRHPCAQIEETYLDEEAAVPECEVYVEFLDVEECPPEFADPDPWIEARGDDEGLEYTVAMCRLPRLEAPRCCEEVLDSEILSDGFGWVYCWYEDPGYCESTVLLSNLVWLEVQGMSMKVMCGGIESACAE